MKAANDYIRAIGKLPRKKKKKYKIAVTSFFKDLESANIIDKCTAIYPMINLNN